MMNNMKFATRTAALLSLGTLLATTACTDYVEEFKEEYKAIYGGNVPHDSSEIPFYNSNEDYLVWQGYTQNNINTTTSDGGSITLQTQENTEVIFRGIDAQGTDITTTNLDDIESLVRKSGAIAGVLTSNDGDEASASINFHFNSKFDLSHEENYNGLAIVLGSSYSNVRVCLQSVDENEPGEYIHEYCSPIDGMGGNTLPHVVKVSFTNLEIYNGYEEFNSFMSKVDGIKLSFTGESGSDFGFKIVALGFYYDGTPFLRSSDSQELESSASVNPTSSASVNPASSASTAKSSFSSSEPKSSSSSNDGPSSYVLEQCNGTVLFEVKDGVVTSEFDYLTFTSPESKNNSVVIDTANGYLNVDLTLNELGTNNYVAGGISFGKNGKLLDMNDWGGLCIVLNSNNSLAVEVAPYKQQDFTENDNPYATIPQENSTSFYNVKIDLSTLTQNGWGKKVETTDVLARAENVSIGASFSNAIGAVNFKIAKITTLNHIEKINEISPAVIDSLDNALPFLWDGKSDSIQIDSNSDKGSISAYSDGSAIIGLGQTGNISKLYIKEAIDSCGIGICGSAIVDSSLYAIANVEFTLTKSDQGIDLTAWKGLCIKYTSTQPTYLSVRPNSATDEGFGYNIPAVELEASATTTTVNAHFSEFRQMFENEHKVSGPEMAKIAKLLQFSMKAGTTQFHIYEIGSYGACSED